MGLIGASIGLAATAAGYHVTAYDTSPECNQLALTSNAAHSVKASLAEAVHDAQIVIVCTPPEFVADTIWAALAFTGSHVIITDVTSTKVPLIPIAQAESRFIPGHPMAGSERHGAQNAQRELFKNAIWPLCPATTTPLDYLSKLESFITAIGAIPMQIDAAVHDASIAITSHLPHIAAYAMYAMARQADLTSGLPVFELAAGGFHSATRVAASSPAVWTQILTSNRIAVVTTLTSYVEHLDQVRDALSREDDTRLYELLSAGVRNPDHVVRYPTNK